MTRFMLDTNVLSDIGNERAGWQRIVSKIHLYGQHRCVISAITWHELRYGIASADGKLKKSTIALLNQVYARFEVMAFDEPAAAQAVVTRIALRIPGKPISWPDVMIAGHARALGYTVVTSNVAEFCRVPGLTVVNWRA